MNKSPLYRALSILLLGVAQNASPLQLNAQTLPELAGVWNNVMFSTPAQLTLQRQDNNITFIREYNAFDVGTGRVVAAPDGTFTGMANGSLSIASAGRVQVNVPGQNPILFDVNAGNDFMCTVKIEPEHVAQDIELLLKAPASLELEEMTGTWRMVSLATPGLLQLVRPDGLLVDLIGYDEFKVSTGVLEVHTDGTFTLNIGEQLTGTVSLGTEGVVQVHVSQPPPDPALTMQFFVNAGKDVMAGLQRNGAEHQELILLVKSPAASELAEAKGLWHLGSFKTPSRLYLDRDLQSVIVNITSQSDFDFHRESIAIGHTGFFTAPTDGTTGTLSMLNPGTFRVDVNDPEGDPETRTLWVNTGKDVLISVAGGSANELLILTRSPAPENPAESMGMTLSRSSGSVGICWASDTNRVLQTSVDLTEWQTLTNTLGSSCYSPDPATAPAAYYRLQQEP